MMVLFMTLSSALSSGSSVLGSVLSLGCMVIFYEHLFLGASTMGVSAFSYGCTLEGDWMSSWLSILLVYISCLMLSTSCSSLYMYKFTQMTLSVILLLVFYVKDAILFYSMFEFSLIPISLMILGWGYQPERLQATVYMLIYTIVASMPLLLVILWISSFNSFSMPLSKWGSVGVSHADTSFSSCLLFMTMLAFMVKLPVYGLHLWLPKAHVEAPIEGSVILAGLLLKVGGFGMVVLSPFSAMAGSEVSMILSSLGGIGGVLISVLCIRVSDLKMLIAYSSVGHMSLTYMCLFSQLKFPLLGGFMVMMAHGLSSPAMFSGAYLMYLNSKSRNLMLNSSGLALTPYFCLLWFLVCLANMAAPPTLNLLSEVAALAGMWWVSYSFIIQIGSMIFLSGAYTLVVYSFTQHSFLESAKGIFPSMSVISFMLIFSYILPLMVGFIYSGHLISGLPIF